MGCDDEDDDEDDVVEEEESPKVGLELEELLLVSDEEVAGAEAHIPPTCPRVRAVVEESVVDEEEALAPSSLVE